MRYIKKEREGAILRMGGGSWTINLDIVDMEKYDEIEYITPKATYLIRSDEALAKGFMRVLGGENKLVVPLQYWETRKKSKNDN